MKDGDAGIGDGEHRSVSSGKDPWLGCSHRLSHREVRLSKTKFGGSGSCVSNVESSGKASSIWVTGWLGPGEAEAAGLGVLTSEIDAGTVGLDCSYLVTQRRDCA